MGKVFKSVFGGGNAEKLAREQMAANQAAQASAEATAATQAAEARRGQQVASDRQLSALNMGDKGARRRNPRGRRLFTSNASDKSVLG